MPCKMQQAYAAFAPVPSNAPSLGSHYTVISRQLPSDNSHALHINRRWKVLCSLTDLRMHGCFDVFFFLPRSLFWGNFKKKKCFNNCVHTPPFNNCTPSARLSVWFHESSLGLQDVDPEEIAWSVLTHTDPASLATVFYYKPRVWQQRPPPPKTSTYPIRIQ